MRSGRVRRRSTVGLVLSDQTERPVLEVSGMGGGSTFVHVYRRSFLVKIGVKFQPLCNISNISTSDPPVLLR